MKTERLRDKSDDMGGSSQTNNKNEDHRPTYCEFSFSLSLSTSSLTLLSVRLPNKPYFQTHVVKTINFSFLLFFPIHGFIFQLLIHSKFFQFFPCSGDPTHHFPFWVSLNSSFIPMWFTPFSLLNIVYSLFFSSPESSSKEEVRIVYSIAIAFTSHGISCKFPGVFA